MNTEQNQKLFLVALEHAKGNVSKACELAGISRQTYYNWLAVEGSEFPNQVLDVQVDAVERRLDRAEEKLDDRIELGSGPDIRFLLKTLGRKRGYGPKQDITVNPGEGFKDLQWPEQPTSLEDWEKQRDQVAKANETQLQEGTDDARDHAQEGTGARAEGSGGGVPNGEASS